MGLGTVNLNPRYLGAMDGTKDLGPRTKVPWAWVQEVWVLPILLSFFFVPGRHAIVCDLNVGKPPTDMGSLAWS